MAARAGLSRWQWAAAALVAVLAAGQLLRSELTNPPDQGEVPAPAAVAAVLRRSCYDCHSNHTVWPWYARVWPVSELMADHVREGRDEVNFTAWNTYSAAKKAKALEETAEVVDEQSMPLSDYLFLHPEARLSDDDARLLKTWAESAAEEADPLFEDGE